MLTSLLATTFTMGLLGGVHCATMCGGIITLLSEQSGKKSDPLSSVSPIRVYRSPLWKYKIFNQAFYHGGRISSYMVLGGIMGGVGPLFWKNNLSSQTIYILANGFLILIGLNLLLKSSRQLLFPLEKISLFIFRYIKPLMSFMMANAFQSHSHFSQYALGLCWGLFPCGMVYSALALSAFSGHVYTGMLVMLVFGASTLPNMVLMGSLLQSFHHMLKPAWIKRLAGMLIISFGILGLFHKSELPAAAGWLNFCFGRK